jgi:hypothetical protein
MVADRCGGVGRPGHVPDGSVGGPSGGIELGGDGKVAVGACLGDDLVGRKSRYAVAQRGCARTAVNLTIGELQREVLAQLYGAEEYDEKHEMGRAAAHGRSLLCYSIRA